VGVGEVIQGPSGNQAAGIAVAMSKNQFDDPEPGRERSCVASVEPAYEVPDKVPNVDELSIFGIHDRRFKGGAVARARAHKAGQDFRVAQFPQLASAISRTMRAASAQPV
jgi:hypothetical protein